MEKKNLSAPQFKLKMNLMVQNLLLTSLGMCKFILLHKKHPVTEAIIQFKLFSHEQLDEFIDVIKNANPGQVLTLTLDDELLIYTAMDISCKAYITDLGDEMESLNSSRLKSGTSSFADIRNTILKGSQYVMQGMRETLSGYDQFDDRVDILDNYILVG